MHITPNILPLILLVSIAVSENTENILVKVKQGMLRGKIGKNHDGALFYQFFGVPYAKPPIGNLRFKAPLPSENWHGIKQATEQRDRCYSPNELSQKLEGSEDCLYLNIFTRELPQNEEKPKLKPVMAWIHGGKFVSGSINTEVTGPEFLMLEDIVLVTVAYRLGMLGFLRLHDVSLEIPGNAGLKDQALALKWIKENIASFGGDPDNITLFGESAGSMSVHLHVLSPYSRGLFHKAILQSLSALGTLMETFQDPLEIVRSYNQSVKNEKEAYETLMTLTVDQIYHLQSKSSTKFPKRTFGPVIEAESGQPRFLPKHPAKILLSGDYNKVPMILGYNNREGMYFDCLKRFNPSTEDIRKVSLEDIVPWNLGFEDGSDLKRNVTEELRHFYLTDPQDPDGLRLLLTDAFYVAPIIASVKNHLQTSSSPVYLYRLSVNSSLNFFKAKCGMLNEPFVCHGDDLGYLFKTSLTPNIVPSSVEDVSMRRIVKMWTNFAKFGNPIPEENSLCITWKAVEVGKINFIDIGKELNSCTNPEQKRMNLWRRIYEKSIIGYSL